MQQSNSGRVVTLVAVSQGNIYTADAGDTTWSSPTNATAPNAVPPLNYTGIMFSTPCNQKLFFADGVNWVYYDPSVDTIFTWAATAGTLPLDNQGNAPRLITTWRGRIVLSGLILDPQNWFMSAVSDPFNFDYSPLSITPTQAIAGNNAPQGLIGDVVTALIAYSDDVLIFGGDHTIYVMHGDPMAGGQIDLVSDSIGMAWGAPWCKDPYGNVYFFSNRTGIYTMTPGSQPQRISQPIEALLANIDTGSNGIRLVWNDKMQGLHIFVSPLDAPGAVGATTHFFYEYRTGAWWTDQFLNPNHDPLTCCVFDGNEPGDRVALIGSWDGFVRAIDNEAVTDDSWAINSSVMLGPINSKTLDEMLVRELQAVLGEDSANVTVTTYVGRTAEAALSSTPVKTFNLAKGRNPTTMIQRAAHAVYFKLSASSSWQMESIRLKIIGAAGTGKVRQRGRS